VADDEFPVSSYVDPAVLEGPFYVGYVCLCFLSREFTSADRTDRRLTSRATLRKKKGEKKEKRRGWPPPHCWDRYSHGAFSALNMAIRFSSACLRYTRLFSRAAQLREADSVVRARMYVER